MNRNQIAFCLGAAGAAIAVAASGCATTSGFRRIAGNDPIPDYIMKRILKGDWEVAVDGKGANMKVSTSVPNKEYRVEDVGKFLATVRSHYKDRSSTYKNVTVNLDWNLATSGGVTIYDIRDDLKDLAEPGGNADMGSYLGQRIQPISMVGPYFSYRSTGNSYYSGAAHPNYWDVLHAVDLAPAQGNPFTNVLGKPEFRAVPLEEVFTDASLVAAVRNDPYLRGQVEGEPVLPASVIKKLDAATKWKEVDAILAESGFGNCFFGWYSDADDPDLGGQTRSPLGGQGLQRRHQPGPRQPPRRLRHPRLRALQPQAGPPARAAAREGPDVPRHERRPGLPPVIRPEKKERGIPMRRSTLTHRLGAAGVAIAVLAGCSTARFGRREIASTPPIDPKLMQLVIKGAWSLELETATREINLESWEMPTPYISPRVEGVDSFLAEVRAAAGERKHATDRYELVVTWNKATTGGTVVYDVADDLKRALDPNNLEQPASHVSVTHNKSFRSFVGPFVSWQEEEYLGTGQGTPDKLYHPSTVALRVGSTTTVSLTDVFTEDSVVQAVRNDPYIVKNKVKIEGKWEQVMPPEARAKILLAENFEELDRAMGAVDSLHFGWSELDPEWPASTYSRNQWIVHDYVSVKDKKDKKHRGMAVVEVHVNPGIGAAHRTIPLRLWLKVLPEFLPDFEAAKEGRGVLAKDLK
jgi:hypothetical protein